MFEDDEMQRREVEARLLAHHLALRALLMNNFIQNREEMRAVIFEGIRVAMADEGATESGRDICARSLAHISTLFAPNTPDA